VANSYSAPNFNIDTSTNVAGLTALKGSAPALTDKVYVYNGATLTIEQNLSILLISLGETSSGAAGAGNRYGYLTVNAGVTVTFAGDPSNLNSGVKSNPASADASSRGIVLTINGASGSNAVFTNDGDALATGKRWQFYMIYGSVQADYLTARFPYHTLFVISPIAGYTTASSMKIDHLTATGFAVAAGSVVQFYANCSIPVSLRFWDITGDSSVVGINMSSWSYLAAGGSIDNTGLKITGNGTTAYTLANVRHTPSATPGYSDGFRLGLADTRPTQVVPAGLALTDPATNGELRATITNAGSYASTDMLRFYNNTGDVLLASGTIAQYNADGYAKICGLANGTTHTIYAKATSDGFVFSAASGTATATPTQAPAATAPSGLTLADAETSGELDFTISNFGGLQAGATLVFHDASHAAVASAPAAASGRIGGLADGQSCTLHAHARAQGYLDSAASGAATATPTAPVNPTCTAPAGLALADAESSGELDFTISNFGSLEAGATLLFHDAAHAAVAGAPAAASGRIGGLADNQSYTLHAHARKAEHKDSAGSNAAAATPTGGAEPSAPELAAADAGTGDSVLATVAGDPGVTNAVYYRSAGDVAWTLGGSRLGDGQVTVAGLAGLARYPFVAVSESGPMRSLPSNVAVVLVADGGASPETQVQANVAAILRDDQVLGALSADWPAHVFAAPATGRPGARGLRRMPSVEVSPVAIVRAGPGAADAEELRGRVAITARLVEHGAESAAAIHDLAGQVLAALKAQPQFLAPELVAGFTATIAAPAYDPPVWTAKLTLDIALRLDPATRGPAG